MITIINQLRELSYNLYWSYNNDFFEVFEEINKDIWKWSQKNPVKFLASINSEYLLDVIEKKNLREKIYKIYRDFRKYLNEEKTYFNEKFYKATEPQICYLSAEYGITKCLKFYSGGLGTLSGDHLKSASDLGIPLIGIGLAYSHGYLRQYINNENRQAELYEVHDFNYLPMILVLDKEYKPLKISITLPGREVFAQIWELSIGRIKLYLLDTFVEENDVEDKRITDILYGGDSEKRIQQEILLGIGGMKLLESLGFNIKAFHINEGHSAFLCLERIRGAMKKFNLKFDEAKTLCYFSNIFTTHTPVPAGIDVFHKSLMEKYFKRYAEEECEIPFDRLFEEGDLNRNGNNNGFFNMAYLAINNSQFVNAVSKSHCEIARKMWSLPPTRSQIVSITNGIHIKTYLSKASEKLYIKYFGKDWIKQSNIWNRITEIPDEEIWQTRIRNRKELINYVRERISDKLKLAKASEERLAEVENLLDENALTIGFARRFATYKRGTLLFNNPDRLRKIISNPDYKIQFIFSGKAHPKDEGGKNLIAEIVSYSYDPAFKNKLIFIENYDIDVAKYLVSGCDLWLNNPRRPLEASGTSGMKVVANLGLNFSILDGWWIEGFTETNGWKIESPKEENLSDFEVDKFEANSLYDTLENEIIPLFYKRNENNIPLEWIQRIKSSILTLAPYFNTERMVQEYTEKFYMRVK
ncbi:MAG: alpha-glucan family phosphorylase [Ignavibacteria bacterium]|nr:alpha-glucan family phosphorylase [Ignavibacteria bacterium]